jgi:UDP-glucose 4-epimerase
MNVLVTGGTGFIGSGVVGLLLDTGHTVRILTRRHELPEELRKKNTELLCVDLKDYRAVRETMKGIDLFYHIGEIRNVNEEASHANIKLLEEIIAGMKETGIGRLVFISSLTVAGIPKSVPAVEDTEPEVVLGDHYTNYKRTAENLLVETLPGRHVIVRPAPVYGPGSRYMSRFLDLIEKIGPIGFPFIGNGRNIAPLIYVRDLARAIYLSGLLPSASDQIFNLTDGLRHSWFDFLTAIMDRLGKKFRIMPIPPLLLKLPAIPFDMLSGFFDVKLDPVQYMNYFSRDLWFDNEKARSLLDWRPEYTLDRGVAETVEFYRGKS